MIKYKTQELYNGEKQSTLTLFGFILWVYSFYKNNGWFRIFGPGLSWQHNSIKPIFSERIGKRKKLIVGNYRYRFLNNKI